MAHVSLHPISIYRDVPRVSEGPAGHVPHPRNASPGGLALGNYVNIWKDIPLLTYFKNSFIVAVFGTALCIVCAVPGAYALARMNFPGKKTLMSLIVMTQMFSPVVLMVGIYRAMSNFGLANSLVGIVLLVAAFNQAFAVWLLSGTFATISKELEEAARIDGCNKLSAMIRIILPLAAPGCRCSAVQIQQENNILHQMQYYIQMGRCCWKRGIYCPLYEQKAGSDGQPW